jgi:hypothetical protein
MVGVYASAEQGGGPAGAQGAGAEEFGLDASDGLQARS